MAFGTIIICSAYWLSRNNLIRSCDWLMACACVVTNWIADADKPLCGVKASLYAFLIASSPRSHSCKTALRSWPLNKALTSIQARWIVPDALVPVSVSAPPCAAREVNSKENWRLCALYSSNKVLRSRSPSPKSFNARSKPALRSLLI